MRLSETIAVALRSLRMNKLRSALTLLGVIIGIMAVIAILTLGSSLQTQFKRDLDNFGANNLQVEVKFRDATREFEQVSDVDALIDTSTINAMQADLSPEISQIIIGEYPSYSGTFEVAAPAETAGGGSGQSGSGSSGSGSSGSGSGGAGSGSGGAVAVAADSGAPLPTLDGSLQTTNPGFIASSRYSIIAGRGLEDDDVASSRPAAVLSKSMVDELFNGDPASAVGASLDYTMADGSYLALIVVGVYEPPKSSALFSSGMPSDIALVPYSLEGQVSTMPGAGEAYPSFAVRVAPDADKQAVGRQIEDYLGANYRDDPDYTVKVTDYSEDLASFNQMVTTISLVVAAIGGISLLVGGIGVMNIMLITVTERTREIGIRMALGARRRDIRAQFIIEAIVVCLIGGLMGVILGSAVGMVGATMLGAFVTPPIIGIVISLLFSLAIGLFFGFYPANRAARLDPIEALRRE